MKRKGEPRPLKQPTTITIAFSLKNTFEFQTKILDYIINGNIIEDIETF